MRNLSMWNVGFLVVLVGVLAYGQYTYKSMEDDRIHCANLISISNNTELTNQIWTEMADALEQHSELNTSVTAHHSLVQKLQSRFSPISSIAFNWPELKAEFWSEGRKTDTPNPGQTDEIRLNDGAETRQLVYRIKSENLAGASSRPGWADREYDVSVHCRSDVHSTHPPR